MPGVYYLKSQTFVEIDTRKPGVFWTGRYLQEQEFAMAKKATSGKPMSKTEILNALAEGTSLTKKQVGGVLDELAALIGKNLGKRGPGVFNVPGLMKITVVRKPATPARRGINPFTGLEQEFKAKPARNVVKIRPLKALKDMV
jgi:nucleoid DNA-binding protein